jgi:hypothetical protein
VADSLASTRLGDGPAGRLEVGGRGPILPASRTYDCLNPMLGTSEHTEEVLSMAARTRRQSLPG